MSDKVYGTPMAVSGNHSNRKYGYLFYNCMIYNVCENNGVNNFGGPWGENAQATFYNTKLDNGKELYGKSKEVISEKA